jgi:O-antigen ligase
MVRYIVVSVVGGILFGVLDGLINANPLAQSLYRVYQPIARPSIDPVAGSLIDLVYGFVMAGVFLLLYKSLPGKTGLVKGLSFAGLVWFFRVVMSVASQWMMFAVPGEALLYSLLAGLGEMLILGVLYGVTLKAEG